MDKLTIFLILFSVFAIIKAFYLYGGFFNELIIFILGLCLIYMLLYTIAIIMIFFVGFGLISEICSCLLMLQNAFILKIYTHPLLIIFEISYIIIYFILINLSFKAYKELLYLTLQGGNQNIGNDYEQLNDYDKQTSNNKKFPGKGIRVGGS